MRRFKRCLLNSSFYFLVGRRCACATSPSSLLRLSVPPSGPPPLFMPSTFSSKTFCDGLARKLPAMHLNSPPRPLRNSSSFSPQPLTRTSREPPFFTSFFSQHFADILYRYSSIGYLLCSSVCVPSTSLFIFVQVIADLRHRYPSIRYLLASACEYSPNPTALLQHVLNFNPSLQSTRNHHRNTKAPQPWSSQLS